MTGVGTELDTFADLEPIAQAIESGMGWMMAAVCQIAELLELAKTQVEKGKYLQWVQQRLPFSEDTAERILRAARVWKNNPEFAALPMTAAALLDNAPDTAIQEILDLTKNSKKTPGVRQIRVIVWANRRAAEVAALYNVDNDRTLAILSRLAQNNASTFDEVRESGCIQPGDEGEAVHIGSAPALIEAAIGKKEQQHQQLALEAKAADLHLFIRPIVSESGAAQYGIVGFASEKEAERVLKGILYGSKAQEQPEPEQGQT